jgi:hypothetical protein
MTVFAPTALRGKWFEVGFFKHLATEAPAVGDLKVLHYLKT